MDKKFESLIKTVRQEPYLNFMPLGLRNPDGFEENVIWMDKSFQEKNPNKNVESSMITTSKNYLLFLERPKEFRMLLRRSTDD